MVWNSPNVMSQAYIYTTACQFVLMLQLSHSKHHESSIKWSYLPVSKVKSANTMFKKKKSCKKKTQTNMGTEGLIPLLIQSLETKAL